MDNNVSLEQGRGELEPAVFDSDTDSILELYLQSKDNDETPEGPSAEEQWPRRARKARSAGMLDFVLQDDKTATTSATTSRRSSSQRRPYKGSLRRAPSAARKRVSIAGAPESLRAVSAGHALDTRRARSSLGEDLRTKFPRSSFGKAQHSPEGVELNSIAINSHEALNLSPKGMEHGSVSPGSDESHSAAPTEAARPTSSRHSMQNFESSGPTVAQDARQSAYWSPDSSVHQAEKGTPACCGCLIS